MLRSLALLQNKAIRFAHSVSIAKSKFENIHLQRKKNVDSRKHAHGQTDPCCPCSEGSEGLPFVTSNRKENFTIL